jgi:hypothetical protein
MESHWGAERRNGPARRRRGGGEERQDTVPGDETLLLRLMCPYGQFSPNGCSLPPSSAILIIYHNPSDTFLFTKRGVRRVVPLIAFHFLSAIFLPTLKASNTI